MELVTPGGDQHVVANNPFYRAYFQCWNEQRYYEAHDVLEHLWLHTNSDDANFFKGLIQAAGAFVHLQKNYEAPSHPKHGRRLAPAIRLFRLAETNLAPYSPIRHAFDVAQFILLLRRFRTAVSAREPTHNPWSPENAPTLHLQVGS